MRRYVEELGQLLEDGRITVFGYVRGNALDFGRILNGFFSKRRRESVTRMKKAQSGDWHVTGTTMFKLVADEGRIESAIAEAQLKSNGMFTIVKRYEDWVPGFLDDVVKEQ